MGFLPRDPLFRDDTKGATPPLDSPQHCRESDVRRKRPHRAAPRQTSGAFAEEEGGAAKRPKPDARGRLRDAELVPTRTEAEAPLTDLPQIRCQNAIQWQSSFHLDRDRLGKLSGTGVSPAIFGDFLSLKSHPGPGRGGPGAIK